MGAARVSTTSTGYDDDQADASTASVFAIGDGSELDPADAPKPIDEQRADAERFSMRALDRRGVSASEMRTLLAKHDLDDTVVSDEVDRLLRVGLLNDEELAMELVDRLHTRKKLGRQAIVQELRRRGIEQETIDLVLEADDDGPDAERARAVELATKRAGTMRSLDRATAERRLSGFLMRKGYGSSTVRYAVDRALNGGSAMRTVRFE
jgi:regulatory protein